jgi:hypothetical protein
VLFGILTIEPDKTGTIKMQMKNINKKSTSLSGVCLIMLTVLFSVSAAHAGNTWQVDKSYGSGLCNGDNRRCNNLKEAVATAESGDKINVNNYRYDGEYDIFIENKNLEIIGAGQPQISGTGTMVDERSGTWLDANNIGRVFRIKNSIVSISGMWITGGSRGVGDNGGAVLIEGADSKVTFRNVKITGNTGSAVNGGAIYNDAGTLNLSNTYIVGIIGRTNHRDGGNGGGLYNKGGEVFIADSVFQSCDIGHAGNGNMFGIAQNRRGFEGGNGGAIYNNASGTIIITSSEIVNNKAGNGGEGGGENIANSSHPGGTGGDGGGIYNEGSMFISDTTIAGNAGGLGGQGGDGSTSPDMGNYGGGGGGIFNNGELTLVNSTVSSNATGKGGDGGESRFAKGGKGGDGGAGGGIYNSKTLEMTNVTVSANTTGAGGSGGWAA